MIHSISGVSVGLLKALDERDLPTTMGLGTRKEPVLANSVWPLLMTILGLNVYIMTVFTIIDWLHDSELCFLSSIC